MIVSSLAEEGAEQTVAALALGAADTMPKPGTGRFNGNSRNPRRQAEGARLCGSQRADAGTASDAGARSAASGHAADPSMCSPSARRPAASMRSASCSTPCRQHRRSDPCHPAFANPVHVRLRAPARRRRPARGGRRRRRHGACRRPILVAPGDAHLTLEPARSARVVRLTHGRSSSGCMPSVDPMLASVGAILRLRRAGRRADRYGPRRRRRRVAAGRVRRVGDRPG